MNTEDLTRHMKPQPLLQANYRLHLVLFEASCIYLHTLKMTSRVTKTNNTIRRDVSSLFVLIVLVWNESIRRLINIFCSSIVKTSLLFYPRLKHQNNEVATPSASRHKTNETFSHRRDRTYDLLRILCH